VNEVRVPVHPWLSQFPAEAQPLITAWFASAASQGPQTPDALLARVTRLVNNKLDWSTTTTTRELCSLTLLALTHQRAAALTYATTFLPHKERL
jgi:hypothetical protein